MRFLYFGSIIFNKLNSKLFESFPKVFSLMRRASKILSINFLESKPCCGTKRRVFKIDYNSGVNDILYTNKGSVKHESNSISNAVILDSDEHEENVAALLADVLEQAESSDAGNKYFKTNNI